MEALYGIQLSRDWWAREFRCRGEDEGKPCACHGAVRVDRYLVDVLQVFRDRVGVPVMLTSAFRCDPYNEAVGGHPRSYHRVGKAADVTSIEIRKHMDVMAAELGEIIEDVIGAGRGNVIVYKKRKFIHVDVGHRVGTLLVREHDDSHS